MNLKLTIYADRFCRKAEREAEAEAFDLSTGICEDVLNIINIDMFDGGLEALSSDSGQKLMIDVIKNGYPFFKELVKDLFDLDDEEVKRTKIADVAKVIIDIVKYSVTQLANSLGGSSKN